MTAKTTSMRRYTGVLLALGLIASLVVVAGPASGAPLPCQGAAKRELQQGTRHGFETLTLRMFHIEAKSKQPVYRIGDTATFPIELTRPAKEDPLKEGLPWDRPIVEPASDVNVGVGLLIGDVFLPGFAVTDENGQALVKIKLERYVRPSTADAAFYAWNVVQESPCLTIQEDGFRVYQGMFKVKK
jgi:hypothetical protein